MSTPTLATPLTAADRCDRCGAQAYLRAEFMNGTLLFCAHHGRTFEVTITEQALDVTDETGRLR